MMYEAPKFSYSGLSVVLSNPSRFDKCQSDNRGLLSAVAGWKFNSECLAPEFNRFQCEIRLADDPRPYIPGTKVVLLLGQKSLTTKTNSSLTIFEARGTPLHTKCGLPAIASFFPQDAVDPRNYEGDFNDAEEELQEEYEEEGKKRGKTKRSNYFFWLQKDTKRAIQVLQNNGEFPKDDIEFQAEIYPSSQAIVDELLKHKDEYMFLDIENDEDRNIRCVGISFGYTGKVFLLPFLDHNYQPAYGLAELFEIYKALAVAFKNNIVVAHYGMQHDFFIFCWRYRLPIFKCEDSMYMFHRCFVEVEKSLGHMMSILTWQTYHKDEGVHTYRTSEQAFKLWSYCCKDVYGMMLSHKRMWEMASKDAGLKASLTQINKSIYPYLLMSLRGITYDAKFKEDRIMLNDKLATVYLKINEVLCGKEVDPLISNKKCCTYFHDMLGYKVQLRSKKTQKPSLNEKALLKLRLLYQNPVINVVLAYRKVIKETGVLKFQDWLLRNDNNSKSES